MTLFSTRSDGRQGRGWDRSSWSLRMCQFEQVDVSGCVAYGDEGVIVRKCECCHWAQRLGYMKIDTISISTINPKIDREKATCCFCPTYEFELLPKVEDDGKAQIRADTDQAVRCDGSRIPPRRAEHRGCLLGGSREHVVGDDLEARPSKGVACLGFGCLFSRSFRGHRFGGHTAWF